MTVTPKQTSRRTRFSIREVLALTLLVALMLGWRSSVQRAKTQLAQQANRLQYAERELERARDKFEAQSQDGSDATRTLRNVNLEGANLQGVTIASSTNAFQRASFKSCNLEQSTLEGGGAAFQFAQFDNSILTNAKLTGGGASFQLATFVNADLTGAELTGGGSSFQNSSFENATLIRARLVGDFQLANISGAHFEAADLSSIDASNLASCYFQSAPTYDDQTKFPMGFDPIAQLWRKDR